MAYLKETAISNAFATEASEAIVVKLDFSDNENSGYTESKRTWKSYFWSTLDVPKNEARFLTKLDLTLTSASALGVMCRYLDQVNITNAFSEFHIARYYSNTRGMQLGLTSRSPQTAV
ncbi:hypothetical protein IFR04_014258 [Cadophora malorum]|uniref:Uncharacterized protein n=1 Tax=Cadophora malorum TaxID=108018 RepID=A0A8H7W0I5_9HELO|nr:hypothetical protein IFR04_014258 [Cadophora malorum]